jgi:hypothetical protein
MPWRCMGEWMYRSTFFLTSALGFTPWPFYPRYPLDRMWGGPHVSCGRLVQLVCGSATLATPLPLSPRQLTTTTTVREISDSTSYIITTTCHILIMPFIVFYQFCFICDNLTFIIFIFAEKIILVIHWNQGFTLKSIHFKQNWMRERNCHQMVLWMNLLVSSLKTIELLLWHVIKVSVSEIQIYTEFYQLNTEILQGAIINTHSMLNKPTGCFISL